MKLSKCTRINIDTLNVCSGALKCRIDNSLQHLPATRTSNGKRKCALHRFVHRDFEYKRDVLLCSDCNVNLCLYCYQIFHKTKKVDDIKKKIEQVNKDYDICKGAREKIRKEQEALQQKIMQQQKKRKKENDHNS